MGLEHDQLALAYALIDEANSADPNRVGTEPLARLQGQKASQWIERLAPDASPALRLAARAHHLCRWTIPRSSYPPGRAAYLRWRRDLKDMHAALLVEVIAPAGFPTDVVERAQRLITRVDLATDAEARSVEDAACLVFLELQLTATAVALHDEAKTIAILRKSAAKMSAAGLGAARMMVLDPEARRLLDLALLGG